MVLLVILMVSAVVKPVSLIINVKKVNAYSIIIHVLSFVLMQFSYTLEGRFAILFY